MEYTQAGVGTCLVYLATFFNFCAMLFNIIGFSTPNLLVGENSPFIRIGFHMACFEDCRNPFCPAGDQFIYQGCYWIWDYYFKEIEGWLRPDWFWDTRKQAIVSIPLSIVCCIVMVIATCVLACWRYPRRKTPCRDIFVLSCVIFNCVLSLATGILLIIILTRFYSHAHDYGWMPMPTRNHFGYSFWLIVVACLCLGMSFIGSLMAVILKILHIQQPMEDPKVAEDMMMGRVTDPLPTIREV